MKKKFLLFSILGLFAFAFAKAETPFETTTVTDGAFDEDTPWYTIRLGANGAILSDNGEAAFITIGTSKTDYADADLWCFTGNDTDGYRLYNKQAGAGKVLASSATMGALAGYGGTGGSTYPILYSTDAIPTDYVDRWDFSESTDIDDAAGFYMKLHGTDYAVNNFGGIGKLAFWAEGADANSTLVIEAVETKTYILESTGSFTASNSNGTWHSRWESSVVEGLTMAVSANNLTTSNDYIVGYSGTAHSSTYTLTAPDGYCIYGYSFDATSSDGGSTETITANGTAYNITATSTHIEVTGLEERIASFVQAGSNKGVVFSNFRVILRQSLLEEEESFEVFETLTTSAIPYRIPAIATAHNGDVIAVADYRYSRSDIGMATNGLIDLRGRISHDNGKTWDDVFTLAAAMGTNAPDSLHFAYGDPCIVADSESPKVMVLSCAGNVSFPSGTRTCHQNIARFYSEDNGVTWSGPVDLAEPIYKKFDASVNHGPVRAMFIGSGKIIQSKTVKAGDYYRVYCAALVKNANSVNTNFVFYSDNFGETWEVLGGVENAPIPSGADEPKVEELPDGSILISSRCYGGRYYNIYSFTNSETAEGYWGTVCFSGASTNGVTATGNSCNGELMLVPVKRNADNEKMFLLLQSVPLGSGRTNVGIYYKELASLSDFVSPDSVAWNWDGRHQSSYLGSAYSTMCLQADSTIGFLYEEETHCGTGGGGYTIVYKNYSIEYLTDSLYSYCDEADRDSFVAAGIEAKTAVLNSAGNGNYVGCLRPEAEDIVNEALDAYNANPSKKAYEALNAALANMPQTEIIPNAWYRLRNSNRSNATLYIKPEASRLTVGASSLTNADQLFSFVPANKDGRYYLYNGNYQHYLGPLGANETQPVVSTSTASAGVWRIESSKSGLSSVICTNKTGSNEGLHLAGDNARLVPWTATAEASLWYIEPVDTFAVTISQIGYKAVNYPFAVTLPEGVTAYYGGKVATAGDTEYVAIFDCGGVVPANTAVLLAAEAGTYNLAIAGTVDSDITSSFSGTLKSATVSGSEVFTFSTSKGYFTKRSSSSGTISANTAYLVSSSTASAINLDIDGETGIENINATGDSDIKFYNLNGQEVQNPTRGIYVTSNGEKVFIK